MKKNCLNCTHHMFNDFANFPDERTLCMIDVKNPKIIKDFINYPCNEWEEV